MAKIDTDTLLIVNPTAGGGAAGRKRELIETLADRFFREHQTLATDRPGRATEFARQALEAGVGQVVCVGGDGTLNEVVNGLFPSLVERKKRPKLGYLPVGTGSDLAKTLGLPANLEYTLRNIATGDGKWVDVGRATFAGPDRETASRYFINVLSVGLGGEVVGRVNRELRCWHLAVANGQYQGGGMRIAPDARIDDGRFKVTAVGDLALVEILLNLPRLYNGNIYTVGKVSGFSGRKIEVDSDDLVLIDLDGEQVGCLPLQVEILPLSLWLCC